MKYFSEQPCKPQTKQWDCVCNRKEKRRWFSTEISYEILQKICTKFELLWDKKQPCIRRKITVRYLLERKKNAYILSNGAKLLKK